MAGIEVAIGTKLGQCPKCRGNLTNGHQCYPFTEYGMKIAKDGDGFEVEKLGPCPKCLDFVKPCRCSGDDFSRADGGLGHWQTVIGEKAVGLRPCRCSDSVPRIIREETEWKQAIKAATTRLLEAAEKFPIAADCEVPERIELRAAAAALRKVRVE